MPEKQILPQQILTRAAFENAIAVAMAVGGSTNAVLHLPAIAHAAGVKLTINDFEAFSRRVPVLCDLKPSGRSVATDLHKAGGIPQVMKMLLAHGHLAILKGNLAEEGAVAKTSGVKIPRITGPARVFDSEEACMEAILARRRAQWKPPAPRYTRGVLAKYAKQASSSSLGAVTD